MFEAPELDEETSLDAGTQSIESEKGLPPPEGEWVLGDSSDYGGALDEKMYGTYNVHGSLVAYVAKVEGGVGGAIYYAPADDAHLEAVRNAGYERNEKLGIPYQNRQMPDRMRNEFHDTFGEDWNTN